MKFILAIILALLIANPLCCCATEWSELFTNNDEPAHSCCTPPEDTSQPPHPDNCPCENQSVADKIPAETLPSLKPSRAQDLPTPAPPQDWHHQIAITATATQSAHAPPDAIHPQTLATRLAHLCTYLL